jgi:hypothetical protein
LAAAKEGSWSKTRAVFESILAGVVLPIFSYAALLSPATLAAIAIGHKMPDAWFAGLITWHARFVVLGVSLVVAGVTGRFVYKQRAGSMLVKGKTTREPLARAGRETLANRAWGVRGV